MEVTEGDEDDGRCKEQVVVEGGREEVHQIWHEGDARKLLVTVRRGFDLVVSVCIRSKEATWYGRGGEAAQLGAREKEGEEGMR
jgi:hypothetical protein